MQPERKEVDVPHLEALPSRSKRWANRVPRTLPDPDRCDLLTWIRQQRKNANNGGHHDRD